MHRLSCYREVLIKKFLSKGVSERGKTHQTFHVNKAHETGEWETTYMKMIKVSLFSKICSFIK